MLIREDGGRCRVVQDRGKSGGGLSSGEADARCTRPKRCEHCGRQIGPSLDRDRDPTLRRDAGRYQVLRDQVCARVQLRVGNASVPGGDGQAVRGTRELLLEQAVDGPSPQISRAHGSASRVEARGVPRTAARRVSGSGSAGRRR